MRVALGAICAIWLVVSAAHAQPVNCPLTQADRQITNALPPEWRQTPFAQRLTGTRITESGALQTLVCDYGEAGSIQREAPREARCTARTGGFDCRSPLVAAARTRTVSPLPLVHRSGTLTLRYDAPNQPMVDFDTGNATDPAHLSLPSHDFRFWISSPTEWEMYSSTGAHKEWPHNGTTPLGQAGCAAERDTSHYSLHYRVLLPQVGRYLCYITSEGRVGELTVTAFGTTPGGSPTVTIRYTTWPN